MTQVVHYPAREQLRERDAPERRMLALERQLSRAEPPVAQRRETFRAQSLQLVEEIGNALAATLVELREAVERIERPAATLLEDDPGSRDPVRALSVNQVAEVVERTECVGTLVGARPGFGHSTEQRSEDGRGVLEHLHRLREVEFARRLE